MRDNSQFQIRKLPFAFATVAVLVVACPWLWWRHKVNSALESTLSTGPDIYWSVDPRQSTTMDNYAYLFSDYERVAKRLLMIAKTDSDVQRQIKSLETLHYLSARS
ncbi:MAG: hypothetical protein ACKVHE_00940 [Planctomycetales bacterium]|jgi:hypothetical protein